MRGSGLKVCINRRITCLMAEKCRQLDSGLYQGEL